MLSLRSVQEKGELREAEKFFQDKIYPIVYKFRWAFVIVLGVLSTFMTVHSFGLQRPTTGDFQLFQIGHPMEDYALFWKRDFYQGGLSKEGARAFFPVRFVWGLEVSERGERALRKTRILTRDTTIISLGAAGG